MIVHTTAIPAKISAGTKSPSYTPIDTFFNALIPTPRGNTSEMNRIPSGNTSAGIVAPENRSIGKYTILVATFIDFTVLQTLAIISPIENMEMRVNNHTPMKISTFPCILYPNATTAQTVKISVEMIAITPLDIVSQASNLVGEHGEQYILRSMPLSLASTNEMGILINALQQIPTVVSATNELEI